MAFSPALKHALKVSWPIALILPLIFMFLIQIPLCTVQVISKFFEHLKPYSAICLITACIILPSYGVLGWQIQGWKFKIIHLSILTLIFAFYLIPLWIFGFYTSGLLFNNCR